MIMVQPNGCNNLYLPVFSSSACISKCMRFSEEQNKKLQNIFYFT